MFPTARRRPDTCSFEGCGRPYRARGLCSSHLDQLARARELTPIRVPKSTCDFPGCGGRHAGNGLCTSHKSQLQRGQPLRPIGAGFRMAWEDRRGYVNVKAPPGHPNARKDGYMFEHVLVMSRMIGRPLRPNEQVHHRNGQKHDNRPENLELWAVHQPKGQRVADLVAWAREILACYGEQYPARSHPNGEATDDGVLPSDCPDSSGRGPLPP